MLQWMGGSRRKVDTSRRSTQKRQQQYFEQRKRQEQQKKDARESFFEEKIRCNQQEKSSRSLDIRSLLNLSTDSGEHKSNVHSARHSYEGNAFTPHNQMLQRSSVIQTNEVISVGSLQHKEGTSPSSQDYAACPKNTSVGAPGCHAKALYNTDYKLNPLTSSTGMQLSIIDILGDDGLSCELESSTHEGHVAFSIEGLGKVEMSTPFHSPQVPRRPLSCGRSSPPRARRKALSFDYLNRGTNGILRELDSMMVDVELPFCTSPLNRSSCSRGTADLRGSTEQELLDTKWFSSSDNNFTGLYTFENEEIFGKSKESSNTIWNANSSFPLPESFHEDCGSPHRSYLYHFDASSTDFWNNQSCGMQEFNFEDCYYGGSSNSFSARNYRKQGSYADDLYHQKQRISMRAKSEFNIIDSPTPYSKHFKPEIIRDFSVSDGEWFSMGCTNPHFMDYIDHAEGTRFANEDARDNSSLLSEESSSSTAVVGDLDRQQKMNSNNKRRSQDISDWSKETKLCEKLFAKGRNCNRNDIQQGKEMDEPTKLSWPPNQSSAKAAHYHPAFYEKRSGLNNDGLREARHDPGEPNSRSRSFFQTSGSKKHVSTCEYASSCFMSEPMIFELGSPRCAYQNLFQDPKKGCGSEDSLHVLGSRGTVTGNVVRDVGMRPDFLSGGDKGVDMQAFDSRQVDPKTEVSGRCKGLSSGKEKSLDGSGSVNKCSDCEEPKEKTPEADRTRLFNYSERAEETSSSVEISTVLKGDKDGSDKNQDSSNKNQDTQSALRCQAGDGVTEADSRSPVTENNRQCIGNTHISRNIQIALGILLLGVSIATVTDLQLNFLGSVLSLLAIVTTCIAQIVSSAEVPMTNTIQKKFKVSSTQLLYQSCPYQALTLFIVGPFLDGLLTNQNVFAFKYTPNVLAFIVLSCLISVSVNFSTFLVIGKTSPVIYQVLGHLKTCLVLAFGYVLLRDPFSWRNILGIFIAVVGMVVYSYCSVESQQKSTGAASQLSQVKEMESDPLLNAEKGNGILADSVVAKAPGWNSNKDFLA